MRIFFCSIIITALFIISCAEVQFQEFKVEECNITSESVEVVFSNNPNQYLFVKSFSMKEDSIDVTGVFVFDNKKAFFYPDDGIKDKYFYEITITTSAEDVEGNSLAKDYRTTYTTRTEFERPRIIQVTPGHETKSDEDITEISIAFSESIDDISFRNSLSFSPSFDYTYFWENDNSVVHISPLSKLNRETRYEIKLSTKLMDENRNTLLNEFRSTFFNYVDTSVPTFSLTYDDGTSRVLTNDGINENIKADAKFKITFSEPINIEYISSYIEIYPALSLTIKPDKNTNKQAAIEFLNDVQWGNRYRLTILHGLKDFANNEIKTDYCYDLIFNHEDNRPVKIKEVLIDLQNPDNNYYELTNFGYLSFEPLYYSTSDPTPVPTNLYFIFDISKNAKSVENFSIMRNFSVDYSNACFESLTVKSVNILSETKINADLKLKGAFDSITDIEGQLCVLSIGLEIVNSTTTNVGILKFSMDKKIEDSLGNIMLDDYSCQVNKI